MAEPWEKPRVPEGGPSKDGLDSELDAFLQGVQEGTPSGSEDPEEKEYRELVGGMERSLAAAKDKHLKVRGGLYLTRWLLENYPAVTGRMTLDELLDFLKDKKGELEDEIQKNGGEV